MILAMVFSVVSNPIPKTAIAATSTKLAETYLNSTVKYLHLGKEKADSFNFNIKSSAQKKGATYTWYIKKDKGNPDAVSINKKTGVVTAKEAGTAYIRCKITFNDGSYVRPEAQVTVRNNITEVDISNLPKDLKIVAGKAMDFNRIIINTSAGKGKKTQGITRWEIGSDTAGVEEASSKGIVFPTKEGEFKIRAVSFQSKLKYNLWLKDKKANSKYITAASDWYTIRVLESEGLAVVHTQQQLDKALKSEAFKEIAIVTNKEEKFVINKGDYLTKSLNVDSPKADVENHGTFKDITINAIKDTTWIEYANGNIIHILDKNSSFTVDKNAEIKRIIIDSLDSIVNLEINGKVEEIKVLQPSQINLSGNSKNVSISVETGAEGTVIDRSSATIELHIDNKSGKPVIVTKNKTNAQTIGIGENKTINDTSLPTTTSPSPTKPSTGGSGDGPVANPDDLSYEGYELKWSDEFNGTSLNKDDWNVETHEVGWVNNELQEYVDSEQNIFVDNGNLVIKPIKSVADNGAVTYTSGRVNTQNKHDYIYGLFEVRAKVPAGKGYLPAFWLMATDENLYGQWPRCGEIDIMEIMGQETNKLYGTVHYGNPHSESQGTYVLKKDNFADNYHTFSCEWEPGKIRWYVDGILYHEERDWYSTTVGQGTVTYPAPFDQQFYMILNLAVGGNWVGNPDATTDFDSAAYVIDYVKVYQKDSYDENVTRPIKEVVLRDPDNNGNYINNGDFSIIEDLNNDDGWKFMTALEGEAVASISNNEIIITTSNAGTVDYSVQLVQADIPLEKGATYTVSFDAKASEARSLKVAVKAPDRGYTEYMTAKTVELTTDKNAYVYEFKMESDSDSNGRLEFNMGATASTADIYISNVSIKKTKPADPSQKEVKTILADGNYVYNGGFQEGDAYLAYWEIINNVQASVSVTKENMARRLKVTVASEEAKAEDVLVGQCDLAIEAGKVYALSFDAQADAAKDMKIVVAGQEVIANLTTDNNTYNFKFVMPAILENTNIAFYMGEKGTTYLDNVRLVEDAMIKNGSFDAGFAGYEWFVDSSADASSVVDSLTEDNAADITIKNTGDMDWKIQIKQNNVELQNGQWYKLSFKAKSSILRKIRVIMQGLEDKGWAVYSGENIVSLTNEYETFEKEFMMTATTDPQAFFCIALGAVDGEVITTQHRVCIDDISLVKIDAPINPGAEAGVNILKNADFADPVDSMKNWTETIASWEPVNASTVRTVTGGAIEYNIINPGTEDWNVQLKQSGLSLEEGKTYKVTFDVISTASREIKSGVMSTSYAYYGGSDIALVENVSKKVEYTFTMSKVDPAADFYISMGKIANVETPPSTITISNLSFVKVDE